MIETKRKRKPKLVVKEKVDPEILKQRLKEKEEIAIKNRELALKKVVTKLVRHDDHARLVLERKKQLQNSDDDLPNWDHNNNRASTTEDVFESMGYRTGSGRSNATDATASDDAEPRIRNQVKSQLRSNEREQLGYNIMD
jgi:hypothetical protein